MRTLLVISALAIAAPAAQAAPAARTFDLVTYTAPDGFTVDASARDHVLIQRVGSKSYCVIGIYNSADASADLDASFAAEWKDVVDRSVDPVDVPASQHATIAGAPAVVGAAMTTTGGKPVLAMLTTIDAGAKVVSILVLTPNPDDLKVYTPSITSLLDSLAVKRVEPATAASTAPAAPAPSGKTITRMGGKITVPIAPRGLTLADLDGEWTNGYESATTYVSATTGAYAGYIADAADKKWVVNAKKGTIESHSVGTHAGGGGGAFQVVEDFRYKVSLTADGDLVMIRAAGNSTFEEHYIVRGWQVGPDLTVMILSGDYFDQPVPDRVRSDSDYGGNLDEVWFRVVKKRK